jgi:hypothetical protein
MPKRPDPSAVTRQTRDAVLAQFAAIERGEATEPARPVRAIPGDLMYALEHPGEGIGAAEPDSLADLLEVTESKADYDNDAPEYEKARRAFLAAGERRAAKAYRLSDALRRIGVDHAKAEAHWAHIGQPPLSDATAWTLGAMTNGDASQWAVAIGGANLDQLIAEAREREARANAHSA